MPGICQVFFSGLDRGPGFWGEEYRGEVPSAHPLGAHAVSVTDHCAVDLPHLAEVWLAGFPAGTSPQAPSIRYSLGKSQGSDMYLFKSFFT